MTAETLRRAASLMRERALDARAGRWLTAESTITPDAVLVVAEWEDKRRVATCGGSLSEGNENNAVHIASWHPAVALAVADWLDEVAYRSEQYPKQYRAAKHALAVARAYLGDDQ